MLRRPTPTALFVLASLGLSVGAALGADELSNPRSWRPMVNTDLRLSGPASSTYAQLWADLIAKNNELAIKKGMPRRLVGNAPIREAHVVVRNATTVATLSILQAPVLCQPHNGSREVLSCPLRLVVHRNGAFSIREATGCLAETNAAAGTGSFVSYDVEARVIRLGTLLQHQAVDGCSKNVPVQEAR